MSEYPRGRPPKCYRKAMKYSECQTCMWLNYCKPKPVPIQAVIYHSPDPSEFEDVDKGEG